MAYKLKELNSQELASMYQEYLQLSEELANREINQLEALQRVEKLEVVDKYDAKWSVDPSSAKFVMVDANGVRTIAADPRMFQPADPDQTAHTGIIPEFEYKPDVAEAPINLEPRKMAGWKKLLIGVGAFFMLFAVFLAGVVTHNMLSPDIEETAMEQERPVVEDGGPPAERTQQVFSQLGSGDQAKVEYVVPNEANADMIRYATAVLGSLRDDGYRFQENRTEEGVSVLQILDDSDNVVLQGDLTWVQDAAGVWVLDEVPVMSPVNAQAETVTLDPSENAPNGDEAPEDEVEETTPAEEPTEEATAEDEE